MEHNNINTDAESRPRKRQCRRGVRFSSEEPRELTFDNFLCARNEQERNEICQQVWYTRQEFDSFLEDRLHTIRMWRAVGGNTRLIEAHCCIRGLEMYESARLNANVLAARMNHIQAVLQEQMRQRQSAPGKELDWEALAAKVTPKSTWAKRQAARLALRDSIEVQDVMESASNGFSMDCSATLATMKRLSMPFVSSNPDTATASCSLSSLYNTTTASQRARAPVDVQKLKEMNRQFLQSMTEGKNASSSSSSSTMPLKTKGGAMSSSNSLALMLVRGRQHALQNNPHQQQQQQIQSSLQADSSLLVSGLRRDSLAGILQDATQYSA